LQIFSKTKILVLHFPLKNFFTDHKMEIRIWQFGNFYDIFYKCVAWFVWPFKEHENRWLSQFFICVAVCSGDDFCFWEFFFRDFFCLCFCAILLTFLTTVSCGKQLSFESVFSAFLVSVSPYFICFLFFRFEYLFAWLFIWLFGWLFVCLFVCLFICLFVCLFICLFVCLFACF
jgi:hypothetical protein